MRGACGFNSGRGRRDDFQDLAQDEEARLAGLLQRLLHDLGAQAGDLDIHLQGGDALCGAGDFEIHVAQVVFGALDVGQDLSSGSPSLTRPMATPATGALIGTPVSISARVEPQTEAIEDEPLEASTSDTRRRA